MMLSNLKKVIDDAWKKYGDIEIWNHVCFGDHIGAVWYKKEYGSEHLELITKEDYEVFTEIGRKIKKLPQGLTEDF